MGLLKYREPALKTNKWKSAEEKKRAMELAASWEELKKRHPTKLVSKPSTVVVPSKYTGPKPPPGRSTGRHIPSRSDTVGQAVKKDVPVYTGTECIGIAVAHKSCLQPVFNEQSAKDIASMRR